MGLVAGTAGNISVRLPGEDCVLITPSGIPYDLYQSELMCIVDLEGRLLEGTNNPSSETPMHTAIHRTLGRPCAIVHTHSPYATTFAVLGMPIPALSLEGLGFGAPEIPCTDGFVTPGSAMLGETVAGILNRHPGLNGVLLGNHGVVALGDTIEKALGLANCIEFTARLYYQALCIGKPNILTGEQVERQLRFYAELKAELAKGAAPQA